MGQPRECALFKERTKRFRKPLRTPAMIMGETTTKHLEFIQAVIGRMAGNSFLLKGWTVTLATALIAVAAEKTSTAIALVGLFPAFAFWGLDAYYLQCERLFRALYDATRLQRGQGGETDFCLSYEAHKDGVSGWLKALFSWSVIGLHGIVITALLGVAVAVHFA